ncbi:RNA polymerase subunit sigma [Photobacterium jeanii]|uniref:RNA polymerase subunit sigma n=2 Tax=Photobacterium jeanii TaxID=858640 RepID=A0A178KN22_9GAMM|nr:RNA polymerase subunit sigma [Photobacterium jeanii]PST92801.1 RNA polymerase subunit sigma [Photobacterium jeanii]
MDELSIEQQKALLTRIAEHRDKSAFATIFSYFSPKIRVYGLKYLKQEAIAMELVQETMMKVWRKAHMFDGSKGAASTWIYTIMRNLCFDILRKQQSNREDNYSDDLWPIFEDRLASESNEQADATLSDELLIYIETLPAAQQIVVKEIYLNQRSHQEVADQLGVPVGTVKSRLRLGLQKLRGQLEDNDD